MVMLVYLLVLMGVNCMVLFVVSRKVGLWVGLNSLIGVLFKNCYFDGFVIELMLFCCLLIFIVFVGMCWCGIFRCGVCSILGRLFR